MLSRNIDVIGRQIGMIALDTGLYQRLLFVYGSATIALIAFLWMIQRAFNVQLIGG